jgi:hypothetical protein
MSAKWFWTLMTVAWLALTTWAICLGDDFPRPELAATGFMAGGFSMTALVNWLGWVPKEGN